MKKIIITIVFALSLIDLHSQEFATIHFVNLRILKNHNNSGISNVKIGISDGVEECHLFFWESDKNGNVKFHVNPAREDYNAAYLWIQIPRKDTNGNKESVFVVKFSEIELFKPYEVSKDIKIVLTEYKILSEKEYEKHMKKYGLMPERVRREIK